MRRSSAADPFARIAFLAAACAAAVIALMPLLAAALDVARDPGQAWEALGEALLWRRTATSATIAALVTAIALPCGLLVAWILMRTDAPLRGPCMAALALAVSMPALVHSISWASALRLRGFGAIVVVHALVSTPIVAFTAMRSLTGVSRADHDVRRLLGGTPAVLLGDLRHALPAALAGAGLAATLVLSDFATADFLSSVGPKVSVAADSIYAHHQGLRSAAAVAANVPTVLLALALLAWATQDLLARGRVVASSFERAPRVELGRAGVATLPLSIAVCLAGAIPFVTSISSAGSLAKVVDAARAHADAVGFTLVASAASATLGLALVTALLGFGWRSSMAVVLALALVPLAFSPLVSGIGLVRVWNRPEFDWIYTGPAILVFATAGRYLLVGALPVADGLARIEASQTEAARLLGASRTEAFRCVVWPQVRSSVLLGWCLAFAFALREADSFVMLRASASSLATRVYGNVVFARDDDLAALTLVYALVCAAPLAVLTLGRGLRGARR